MRAQARVADTAALAINRAMPLVVAEYNRIGREVLQASCCSRSAMSAALSSHQRRWAPIIVAWEAAKVSHDAWRVALAECSAQPQCELRVDTRAADFVQRVLAARCELSNAGRGDLDPLPMLPLQCAGRDR